MKSIVTISVALAVIALFPFSAQAIKITVAEVQNGVAFIKGNQAARNAVITWDNANVTKTNNGGAFSFPGLVPNDCVGILSDGVTTIEVTVLNCTPVSQGAPAPVSRTGQTTSYAAGDDGALQKGVAWPNPRFTDNNNGTITDKLTGLIWLKNANCIGTLNPTYDKDFGGGGAVFWQHALDFVAGINNGTYGCGDSSSAGSHQTDWRLPNQHELMSLIDLGMHLPALPLGHPFTGFESSPYWSSTTVFDGPAVAWGVLVGGGDPFFNEKNNFPAFVIAVRGGS